MSQLLWFAGLLTFICTAILGQAEMVGEPWRHYISVLSILGTAITGYMIQHPYVGIERRKGNETILKEINEKSKPISNP